MLESGKVMIDRKITRWSWYKNGNTARLFMHLIITVNYTEKKFEDIVIKRGQRLTSVKKLSEELGLSEKAIRIAIDHLKKTEEISCCTYSKYTLFTVNNYNDFQTIQKRAKSGAKSETDKNTADTPFNTSQNNSRGKVYGNQRANEGQTKGKQAANEGQQCNKDIYKINKEIKKEKEGGAPVFEETGGSPPKESAEPILDKWGGRLDF